MTVASTQNRKTYAGDDATTSFATSPVVFYATSDLLVYITNDTTGVATLKTEATHYTVSGGDGTTGTVSLAGGSSPHGALLSGTTLLIVRELPLTQGADFVNNDASDAEVAETALDKIVMNLQRLDERIGRSVALLDGDVSGASTELPIPEANKILAWDAAATALVNLAQSAITDSIVPTAFMETVLDDANQAAANVTLGSIPQAVIDAAGDLIVGTAADTAGRLAIGTAGKQLRVNAGATAPEWVTMSPITASLGADVALNNTSTFFTGPTIAQGTAGTWFVSGTVTLSDDNGAAAFFVKLWDGTTLIAGGYHYSSGVGTKITVALSGVITAPAGNLRMSVEDATSTGGWIIYAGVGKDSTITAIRIA